jgi:hypothetical protein
VQGSPHHHASQGSSCKFIALSFPGVGRREPQQVFGVPGWLKQLKSDGERRVYVQMLFSNMVPWCLPIAAGLTQPHGWASSRQNRGRKMKVTSCVLSSRTFADFVAKMELPLGGDLV